MDFEKVAKEEILKARPTMRHTDIELLVPYVSQALRSAFRAGEEAMRDKCEAEADYYISASRTARSIKRGIRSLPLSDVGGE